MPTPILTKVLTNNSFYTESYIQDTIRLTKSIIIKNHQEAKLYNDYLAIQIPRYTTPESLNDWRYYSHLVSVTHHTDTPITITSIDNGSTVPLTRATLLIHKKTKRELLKFDLFYDELIKKYPQQQLYIRSTIVSPLYATIPDIVALPDYSIVGYDKSLIEENEHDIIPQLQNRINNYKHLWLIPYYQNSDNLFLASQYHILYTFIFTSLLAIRLENAKTMSAHSFHIRLYLASHFDLDKHQIFLSRRQQLYLYRNLLYLANHSGKNLVFNALINELYNEHNVSVVNYVYHQKNELDQDDYTRYTYNQKLLNQKNLPHNTVDYSLDYLGSKESKLAPSNEAEYTYNISSIDRRNKNSKFSTLLTKDLETILVDETDSVRFTLLDTITDYLAYLIKHDQVNFITAITDPVTNTTVRLKCKDLFKLYCICLYALNDLPIDQFPVYRIKNVFAPTLPTKEHLLKLLYTKSFYHKGYIEEILAAIPMYSYIMTSFQFTDFVTSVYKLNIGLWNLLTNYSEKDTNGQFTKIVDELSITEDFIFNDESVTDFLTRVGVKDPRSYSKPNLKVYTFNILDEVFDKKLSYLNRLKKLQDSLNQVFFKFNSYTVQLVNNYYNDNPMLVGMKDRRYGHSYRTKNNNDIGSVGGGGLTLGMGMGSGSDDGDPNRREGVFVTDLFYVDVSVSAMDSWRKKEYVDISVLVDIDPQVYVSYFLDAMVVKELLSDVADTTKLASYHELLDTTKYHHLYTREASFNTIDLRTNYYTDTRYVTTETHVSVNADNYYVIESDTATPTGVSKLQFTLDNEVKYDVDYTISHTKLSPIFPLSYQGETRYKTNTTIVTGMGVGVSLETETSRQLIPLNTDLSFLATNHN